MGTPCALVFYNQSAVGSFGHEKWPRTSHHPQCLETMLKSTLGQQTIGCNFDVGGWCRRDAVTFTSHDVDTIGREIRYDSIEYR